MDQWRRKVERVGNLNYPEAARKEGLSGRLILEVGLNVNGEVESVAIKKSSGHPTLDRAARKIVYLAGPYAPFPDTIRHEVDTLYITGTWRFIQEGLTTTVQ
jgi:protein TonB